MTDLQAQDLMRRFSKAFFSRDAAEIASVVTEDFEWHFAIGPDAPDGHVHRGALGAVAGIELNATRFEALRFEDVRFRVVSATEILMTCRVDGRRRDGDAFSVRGIELFTIRDGKVAKKDVFWKQHVVV
jgi:ketosteroid isomerase-like protein